MTFNKEHATTEQDTDYLLTLFSQTSFHILCSFYSDLDERWTDMPSQNRAYVNRLYWITYGTASVFVDGREIILEPGHLYLIPTNCILGLKAEQSFGKYWCHFYAPTFNGFDLLEMIDVPIKVQPDNPDKILERFRALAYSAQLEYQGWTGISRIAILTKLLLPFLKSNEQLKGNKTPFLPALQHIQNHIDQEIKLEDLAATRDWSTAYFSRKFRAEFHCSPIQYVILKRVQLAQRMLCLSSKSPKEIGNLCGFNSISRFSKTFKQLTTRSPRQFRESFKSKTPPSEALKKKPKNSSLYPEQILSSSKLAKRLTRGWLRSEIDWLYCNIRFNVLSAKREHDLDLLWQSTEQVTSLNTLFYISKGEGLIAVDGIDITMSSGELRLIPTGSHLEIKAGFKLSLCQCSFSAQQAGGTDLFESITPPSKFVSTDPKSTQQLFSMLEASCDRDDAAWRIFERMSLLLDLLLPFLQHAEEKPRDHVTFMPALLYIRDHLDQAITLEDIATTMGQSPEHFAREFRDALKIPPMHYLMEERISRAKKMLTSTKQSAQAIGEQCGFSTPSHFAKTFKRVTGLTPGQFRKGTH